MRCKQNEEININCSLSSKDNVYLGMQENEQYTALYKPVETIIDGKKKLIGIDLYVEEILFCFVGLCLTENVKHIVSKKVLKEVSISDDSEYVRNIAKKRMNL